MLGGFLATELLTFSRAATKPSQNTSCDSTRAAFGAGFVQIAFLAKIKVVIYELSLLRLCPPLPTREMGQSGQV